MKMEMKTMYKICNEQYIAHFEERTTISKWFEKPGYISPEIRLIGTGQLLGISSYTN